MLPSRHLADLTQPEIAAQLARNPLVILPAGSVEQHGPHLPAGTDTLAANIIGHAVAERMDGLVLPATPLGVTPMHMPFAATVTLTPDTFMQVVTETCAAAAARFSLAAARRSAIAARRSSRFSLAAARRSAALELSCSSSSSDSSRRALRAVVRHDFTRPIDFRTAVMRAVSDFRNAAKASPPR